MITFNEYFHCKTGIIVFIMLASTDIIRSTFQEGTTDPSDQEKEPAIELSQLELGGNKLAAREISYLGDFITEYPPLVSIVSIMPGPEVIKLFPCSTQLSIKFILLINFKLPTIVGILTFISMITQQLRDLKQESFSFVSI